VEVAADLGGRQVHALPPCLLEPSQATQVSRTSGLEFGRARHSVVWSLDGVVKDGMAFAPPRANCTRAGLAGRRGWRFRSPRIVRAALRLAQGRRRARRAFHIRPGCPCQWPQVGRWCVFGAAAVSEPGPRAGSPSCFLVLPQCLPRHARRKVVDLKRPIRF
jgi:hypothetical protein